jgi:hypothetical protein
MGAPPKMILQPPIRKAVLVGTIMTIAGAVFSFALPNTPNYLLLPGMLAVYMATGGYTATLAACTCQAFQFGTPWEGSSICSSMRLGHSGCWKSFADDVVKVLCDPLCPLWLNEANG